VWGQQPTWYQSAPEAYSCAAQGSLQCPVPLPKKVRPRFFCGKNSVGYNRILTLTQDDANYLTTIFGESSPVAVLNDGVINTESWASRAGADTKKFNMPALFGEVGEVSQANKDPLNFLEKFFIRPFRVSELESILLYTKPHDPTLDVHMTIYTQEFDDGMDAGSFYRNRLTVTLQDANNRQVQPEQWNRFSTYPGKNQLRIYDFTRFNGQGGKCSVGPAQAITLDEFRRQQNDNGQVCWDPVHPNCCWNYDDSLVFYIVFETASNIEPAFVGQVDGVQVCLFGKGKLSRECLQLDLQNTQAFPKKQMMQCDCGVGWTGSRCQKSPFHKKYTHEQKQHEEKRWIDDTDSWWDEEDCAGGD